MDRVLNIRARLIAAFSPSELEVVDESEHHIGHAGARDGKGHFKVTIVSDRFVDIKPLARHRMVFAALKDMMQTDIHALSIDARTESTDPEFAAEKN